MEDLQTTYRLIAGCAIDSPDAIAVSAPGRRPLNYRQLIDQIDSSVAALNAMGLTCRDRVGLILPNGPVCAVAHFAVRSGMVCVPISADYRKAEYEKLISQLKISAIIVQVGQSAQAMTAAESCGVRVIRLTVSPDDQAGVFGFEDAQQLPVAPGLDGRGPTFAGPDDDAQVLHTSGTTGQAKQAGVSQRSACMRSCNIRRALQLTADDVYLNMMPLYHSTGIGMVAATLTSGGTIYCAPHFEPNRFFQWLDDCGATWFTASPTMHQAIVDAADDHAEAIVRHRLRFIRSSNAPLLPQLAERIHQTFAAPVIQAYGLTETGLLACGPLPPRKVKAGSVGVSIGPRIAIRNEDGEDLAAGEVGQITVDRAGVFKSRDENGWLETGDEGYLDADGYLFVTGRQKEMINRGGQKVWPGEIEEHLMRHPSVAEAVSFPVKHALLGETVAAAVVMRNGTSGGATPDELRAFCVKSLAQFKAPQHIFIADRLPRDEVGKILRRQIRQQYESQLAETVGRRDALPGGAAPLESDAPRDAIEATLVALWTEALGIKQISIHDDFFALGGHSVMAAQLFGRIEKEVGVRLPLAVLFEAPTIAQLSQRLSDAAASPHSPIVPLKTGGSKPPFFCVHGIGGDVVFLRSIVHAIRDDQPLYALQSVANGQDRLTIESMAARYIDAIREIQPDGPYCLGGYSFGGSVAFEMAQQLLASGDGVAFLGILDHVPGNAPGQRSRFSPSSLAAILGNVPFWILDDLLHTSPRRMFVRIYGHLRAALKRTLGRQEAQINLAAFFGVMNLPQRELQVIQTHYEASKKYQPRPYAGRVTVFKGRTMPLLRPRDVERRWRLLADDVRVITLPGSHSTLFEDPRAVNELSERLCDCLDQGDGDGQG